MSVKRSARRAFTLVELMVVIAIIGLLATVVTVNVIGQMEGANTAKVKADFKAMKDAMKLFKVHLGYWPNGIQDLMQAPGNAGNRWKGPYLDEQPKDPWGHDYIVEPGSPPKIVTLGADGNQGGEGEARDLDSETINASDQN
ncbi:MAG: type II secretion system major pseudopilin GspG [Planctomycetota bacterium]